MLKPLAIILAFIAGGASASEQHCLSLNIYHEARGESEEAQLAVAHVTLNRVASPRFPDSVCDVVKQARRDNSGQLIRHRCQFSWYCDGVSDTPKEPRAWLRAQRLAKTAMQWHSVGKDFSRGALFYHANYVRPYWADAFEHVLTLDKHLFYR